VERMSGFAATTVNEEEEDENKYFGKGEKIYQVES
jgi:hypothetical protein